MADIFISYARHDRQTAQLLAKILTERGWSVWWDNRLQAGELWDEVIERQLKDAHCIIVIWSRASINKTWVRAEAYEGLNRNILVPMLIDDVKPPLAFRLVHTESLIGWPEAASHSNLQRLLKAIAACLARTRSGKLPFTSILAEPAQTRWEAKGKSVRPWSRRALAWVTILLLITCIPWLWSTSALSRLYERVTTPPEVWGIYYAASELTSKKQYQDARTKIRTGLEHYPHSLPLKMIMIQIDISSQNLHDAGSSIEEIGHSLVGLLYINDLNIMRGRLQERLAIADAYELIEKIEKNQQNLSAELIKKNKNAAADTHFIDELIASLGNLIERLDHPHVSDSAPDLSISFAPYPVRYQNSIARLDALNLRAQFINQSKLQIESARLLLANGMSTLFSGDPVQYNGMQQRFQKIQQIDKELEIRLRRIDTQLEAIDGESAAIKRAMSYSKEH